ncbi:hypothetical protein AcW1_009736 [Taiwanofungus camphoratus]|nr:hypothetical protein AcW1_009736 [Antrodia cinnamomea]
MLKESHEAAFPIEIFEEFIAFLVPTHEDCRKALLACALTCRAWYWPSRVHLLTFIHFASHEKLLRLSKMITLHTHLGPLVKRVTCSGEDSLIRLFAVMFARRLTGVEHIGVSDATWCCAVVRPSVYRALSTFTSVKAISLYGVHFCTTHQFLRLIRNLPNLKALSCAHTSCRKTAYNAQHLRRFKFGTKLTQLQLQINSGTDGRSLVIPLNVMALDRDLENVVLYFPSVAEIATSRAGCLLKAAGESLLEVNLKLGLRSDLLRPSDQTVAQELNLSANINLERFYLTVFGNLESTPRGSNLDLNWLPQLLSHITSKQLCHVLLLFVVCLGPGVHYAADETLKALDHQLCASIDNVLSCTKFSKLRQVVFHLIWIAYGDNVPRVYPHEVEWRSKLMLRLPKLSAQGILSVKMWIRPTTR